MSQKSVCFGIDFGTCNIAIAGFTDEKILKTKSFLSSAIYDNTQDKLFFDDSAKITNYDFPLLKDERRLIGRNYSQLDEIEKQTLGIIEKRNRLLYMFTKEKNKHYLSPIDLSSVVIQNIIEKECKQEKVEKLTKKCVMCVPAVYSCVKRYGIKQAFKKTDIEILDIITDTTATALYLVNKREIHDGSIIMICDFGGGIFDVSLIRKEKNRLTVLGNGGDDHLGGEDMLNKLISYVAEKVKDKTNLYQDMYRYRKVADDCENYIKFHEKGVNKIIEIEDVCDVEISEDYLKTIQDSFYNKTMNIAVQTIKECKLEIENIDVITCVGGCSKNSVVIEMLETIFGKNKIIADLDYAVAEGAYIYADYIETKKYDFIIDDSTYPMYEPLYGIDFGSAYIRLSYLKDAGRVTESLKLINKVLPSTVVYSKTNKDTKSNVKIKDVEFDKEVVVYNSKKYLGKRYEEIPKLGLMYNLYKIRYHFNLPMYEVTYNNNENELISPTEITSILFKSIAEEFKKTFHTIDEIPVTITIPLEFGVIERNEILRITEKNNIKVLQLINETSAAALNYCYEKNIDNCNIIVYDFGASKFNLAFINVCEGLLTIKDIDSDNSIGGDYLTKEIIKHIIVDKDENNISESQFSRVLIEVEKCKTALSSSATEYECHLDDNLSKFVNKSDFDNMCKDYIERTCQMLEKMVKRNSSKEVLYILLVGQSCEIHSIKEKVRLKCPNADNNIIIYNNQLPKEIISFGAVMYRKSLIDVDINHYELKEVLTKSIGIEINKIFSVHHMEVVLKKLEILPIRKEIEVMLDNGQKTLEIYEGESSNTMKNKYIGSVDIIIPLDKCKDDKIKVIFQADKNGNLTLKYKLDEVETDLVINKHN